MAITAKKLPSGHYRCRASYTDEKGQYRTKSFTAEKKKDAETAAAIFLMEREHNAKPENKTLGQLADSFIESRSNLLSPSTIVGYQKIRRTAFQSIVDYRIGLLTKEAYQKAVNEYAKGRSYKTVLSAHAFYNKVLKDNKIYIGEDVTLPQKEKKEVEIPSKEEVQTLLRHTVGTRLHLYCLFAICLGLRKSEIIAIKWKDIDLENRTVSINKARVKDESKTYVEKLPKTTEGTRILHLPQILIDELGEEGEKENYVIEDSPDALESLYKRLCKKIGFDYNFHALRHYYASIMLLSGVPNKYAKERMGHATEDMLKNVYQHVERNKQKEYDTVLESFFADNFKIEEEKTE